MFPKRFDKPENKYIILDNSGNVMTITFKGLVHLHLNKEKRPRKLGLIDGDTLFVERNSEKHFHRKTRSYGFNYLILKKLDEIKTVHLTEDGLRKYRIPKSAVLNLGQVLNFKYAAEDQSFEVQIFLRKDYMQSYRTENTDEQ